MKKQDASVLNLGFLQNYSLEDDIYLRIDKLQALCAVQTILDSDNMLHEPATRFHYSLVIEDHVSELRHLVDKLFA